jgi:hypothetical protein
MADVNFSRAAKALEGPAYVAVGFGVLGFQRAQVCRLAAQRRLGGLAGTARSVSNDTMARLGPWRQRVDEAAGEVATHFPPEAVDLARAAGNLAGSLPREARELVNEAVAIGRFALQVVRAPVAKRAAYP